MWEGWNFCNQAGNVSAWPDSLRLSLPSSSSAGSWYVPGTSPRFADCVSPQGDSLVAVSDNLLSFPDPLPGRSFPLSNGVNWYAQEKARYLGSLCRQQADGGRAWEWWTLMVKNGNLDLSAGQCPETSVLDHAARPSKAAPPHFPPLRFGRSDRSAASRARSASGLMNQPLVYQHWTAPHPQQPSTLAGGVLGSFTMSDRSVAQLQRCIAAPTFPSPCASLLANTSFFSSSYSRDSASPGSSWLFSHQLVTDAGYPWLMLYHRADASDFYNGGYNWVAPGMLTVRELASDTQPHFHLSLFFQRVRLQLSGRAVLPARGRRLLEDRRG